MPPPTPVPRITPKTTVGTNAGAVYGLGQGEAICVIFHDDGPFEEPLQVGEEGLPYEAGRVRILEGVGGC